MRHSTSASPMAGLKVGSWSWRRRDEHFSGKTNPSTPVRTTAQTATGGCSAALGAAAGGKVSAK